MDGRAFEALPAKIVALQNLSGPLKDAHHGWDNFYNESPFMREILSYCKKSTDIPKELLPSLVPVILSCRLGRGLSYHEGVSSAARPLYDQFLGLLDDDGVVQCLVSCFHRDLNSKLSNTICQKHFGAVLEILKNVAISDRLKDAIDFLLADLGKAHAAIDKKEFRELTSTFINGGEYYMEVSLEQVLARDIREMASSTKTKTKAKTNL